MFIYTCKKYTKNFYNVDYFFSKIIVKRYKIILMYLPCWLLILESI